MLPLRSKRKAIRDGDDILVETVDKYSRSVGLSLRRARSEHGSNFDPGSLCKDNEE